MYSSQSLKTHFETNCGRLKWSETDSEIHQRVEKLKTDAWQLYKQVGQTSVAESTFTSIVKKLADYHVEMTNESAYIDFFQYTSCQESQRNASVEAGKKLSETMNELALYKPVFDRLLDCQGKKEQLGPEAQRLLTKWIRDGHRSGLHLSDELIEQNKQISDQINKLCIDFNNNVNSENTVLLFSKQHLSGLPEMFLSSLEQDEHENYKVTLKYPHVVPILKSATNPETRKTVKVAFDSRCKLQNTTLLEEIVALRDKKAKLLGYPTHSDYILEVTMAKSKETVAKFLDELAQKLLKSRPVELKRMLEIKEKECEGLAIPFDNKIHSYDYSYYSNKVEILDYSVDHQAIQQYFVAENVIEKVLAIYQQLLQLKFVQVHDVPVWHEKVSLYAVIDESEQAQSRPEEERIFGYFYLDLYPRPCKYSHAACFHIQSSCRLPTGQMLPGVAAMVANFTESTPDAPALFTHREVETFFHEFGHVMHQICSKAEFVEFSGTNVERDFVEAPSQMLENWLWDHGILKQLTSHYKTKECLDDETCERLLKSRTANVSCFYLRQISFAKLDQNLHEKAKVDVVAEVNKALEYYSGISPEPDTNFAASFCHLTGGYDSRYYGYLWSLVYASDMYCSKFKKMGLTNPAVGLEYRQKILECGGTKDGIDMLKDFLGREPSNEAFIELMGLSSE